MSAFDGTIVLGITTKIDDSVKKTVADIKKKITDAAGLKNEIAEYNKLIEEQKNKVHELMVEAGKLSRAGKENSDEYKQLKAQLAEANSELDGMQREMKRLGDEGKKATDKISEGLKKTAKRFGTMAKNILVMQQLYKVLRYIMSVFSDILMSDAEFKEDWEELKAAFYTAAYPIVNMIVPALKWIVEQVRDWAVSIGKVAAFLQGISYSEMVDQAEASKKTADNYEEIAESAEDVRKSLAGFDKIEILKSEDSSSKSDSASEYDAFQSLKQYDTSGEESLLSNLGAAIGGALVVIGLIMLFHGVVGWGLGFMIAGAAVYAVSEIADAEYSDDKVIDTTAKIGKAVGAILAGLGLILLVCGQWAWGLGFLIAGAGAYGIGEIAANWDELPEKTQNAISIITAVTSTLLLALGIILCFTGAGIALGVGLIIVGVAGLAATVALNWTSITTSIENAFNRIIKWVKTYGLLVLGIILCLTGSGIPAGIGLIYKWAKDNAEEVPLANTIVEKVKGVWDAVKDFWNKHIAQVFTAEWWANLGKGALNGLIIVFETALNILTVGFRSMINGITTGLNKVGDLVGIDWDIPEIPEISLPRLARGAVIPANHEFLAVLGDQKSGTNIEAPLSTIEEAVENVLSRRGNETTKEEHYYLNETELMSVLYKLVKQGERVQGADLVV